MLVNFLNDVRYATRRLLAKPAFTAAAVLTIALGIGLNVASFSVINGLLLRDLPVPEGHELVDIQRISNVVAGGFPNPLFSVEEYEALNDRSETMSGIVAHGSGRRAVLPGDNQRDVFGTIVSCNYFDVLRQPPAHGRAFTEDDCEPGAPPVVILGRGLWETAFGADSEVVGQSVVLATESPAGWESRAFTVVGIASGDMFSPNGGQSEYYATYQIQMTIPLRLTGRRRAGYGIEQVQAELSVITSEPGFDSVDAGLELPEGETSDILIQQSRIYSMSNPDAIASAIGFSVPFGLILLIICANVTNLFLARAMDRSRDLALRLSLGASRARIIQQLLTESGLVAVAGGVLSLAVAFSAFGALFSLVMSYIPDPRERILIDLALDVRVLAFALVLSLGAGMFCGLAPALRLTKPDLNTAMKSGSVTTSSGPTGGYLQSALVGVQVAVCVGLLGVTGLFLRDFYAANNPVEPGFDYEELVVANILHPPGDGDESVLFQERFIEEVRSMPGVETAAFTSYVPWGDAPEISVGLPGEGPRWVNSLFVSPDYFTALGVPIVRGRGFGSGDTLEGSAAVIISESVAREFWQDQNPVGETLIVAESFTETGDLGTELRVVGVSQDTEIERVGEATYAVYRPFTDPVDQNTLVVRSRGDLASLAQSIRASAQRIDPQFDARVWAMADGVVLLRNQSRLVALFTMSVGGLAMALAAIGISGVVAFVVSRQTREIGIRLALGATNYNVLAPLVVRAMRPAVIGTLIGVTGAIGISPLLGEVTVAARTADPISLGGSAFFALAVALFASIGPALRALRVDPVTTLRYE
jgi:putative ABC transport system permease protein